MRCRGNCNGGALDLRFGRTGRTRPWERDMTIEPSEHLFDARAEYLRAIDAVIASAKRTLCVFDSDLKQLELDTPGRSGALAAFLGGGRDCRLHIVLHDIDFVDRYCARFNLLRRRFSHAIEVRQSPEGLRHLADCFILADDCHAAIRFHVDHFRGKLLLDNAEASSGWARRFGDLWLESTTTLPPTQLGL